MKASSIRIARRFHQLCEVYTSRGGINLSPSFREGVAAIEEITRLTGDDFVGAGGAVIVTGVPDWYSHLLVSQPRYSDKTGNAEGSRHRLKAVVKLAALQLKREGVI